MQYDCAFVKENQRFRYRAGGILVHDHKMLFVKSCYGDYYYMIGGAVQMGETSAACRIAEERMDFMQKYLDQFFKEWNGEEKS